MIKLAATRDVWVSAHPDELDTSMGKTPQLKLKGNTEVALLDFDVSSLRGKRVTAAELWVHNVPDAVAQETARLGIAGRPDCLRKIGLSTIGSPWEEGSQDQTYQPDPVGHGATYDQASDGLRDWAYPGSKLWDVIMGNGNTLHCHAEREYQGDGWWKAPADPRLISALVAGLSNGLLLEEESGSGGLAANNYVHSRESGAYAPYLTVSADDSTDPAPEPPASVIVAPAPDRATLTHGAVQVSLLPGTRTFGYLLRMNGADVAAWRVPYAEAAGQPQAFIVDDLPSGGEISLEVRAVSDTGVASSPVIATGRASAALPSPPALPEIPFQPSSGGPLVSGALHVWAYPEITKVDPITGAAVFEPAADLRPANAVWDGARGLVRLAAARGEIAAFQLALEVSEPQRGLTLEITDLQSERGVITRDRIRLFRVWYVQAGERWQEEYAIPLAGAIEIPARDNAIPGHRLQAVYVDLAVPDAAAAGTYRGHLKVSGENTPPVSVDIELVVYPVTIPATLSFNPELNCYSPPGGEVGSSYFYAAHRLAHYHRCTINTAPYSQGGRMTPGYAPTLAERGGDTHVSDWADFDRLIGPLLDGSAFKDNPRAGVPVKTLYLPLFEHWPLSLWDYYPFHGSSKEESVMLKHMLEAPPIETAFPAPYRQVFTRVTADIVSHAEQKGWTGTDFQMYLNNKYDWGGTYWTLDEPSGRDDWQALRFWAQLFKAGLAGARSTHFRFRGDVSRPWWQYDQLEGLMDTIYYNNEIFDLPGFARAYNRHLPDPHVYGTCNDIAAANHESALWCLKAYLLGLNGALPWNSLGEAESLRRPEATALIVPGTLAGYDGPVASLRVFALRRGAQDVEILRLLARQKGYSLDQMAALVAQKVDLGSSFTQTFPEEAAGVKFGETGAQAFAELKEGALALLSR
jgi:hypothetical protein